MLANDDYYYDYDDDDDYDDDGFLILYFVDRASRYNSLLMTKLTHFFISLFITPLHMFRASECSSSGDRIELIHHLV
jgi:hypothetical protein